MGSSLCGRNNRNGCDSEVSGGRTCGFCDRDWRMQAGKITGAIEFGRQGQMMVKLHRAHCMVYRRLLGRLRFGRVYRHSETRNER